MLYFIIIKYILLFSFYIYKGAAFHTEFASLDPVFFTFHSMMDAIWDWWQHKGPEYQQLLMNDTRKLLWFEEPIYLYVNNDNIGGCSGKVKYTNIFF